MFIICCCKQRKLKTYDCSNFIIFSSLKITEEIVYILEKQKQKSISAQYIVFILYRTSLYALGFP